MDAPNIQWKEKNLHVGFQQLLSKTHSRYKSQQSRLTAGWVWSNRIWNRMRMSTGGVAVRIKQKAMERTGCLLRGFHVPESLVNENSHHFFEVSTNITKKIRTPYAGVLPFFFQLTYASIVWIRLSRVFSQLCTFLQYTCVAPLLEKDSDHAG